MKPPAVKPLICVIASATLLKNVRVNDAGDELVVYAAHDMRNKIATCKRA